MNLPPLAHDPVEQRVLKILLNLFTLKVSDLNEFLSMDADLATSCLDSLVEQGYAEKHGEHYDLHPAYLPF